MSIQENVKSWVILDDQIKEMESNIYSIKQKIQTLKIERANYSETIQNLVESNNLQRAQIKLPNNCKLKFSYINSYQPLSFKYLEKCLANCISDLDTSHQIYQYIKSNRETKTNFEIKRYSLN